MTKRRRFFVWKTSLELHELMVTASIVTHKHPTIHKQMQRFLSISTIPIKLIGLKMLIFLRIGLEYLMTIKQNELNFKFYCVLLNLEHVISAWVCSFKGTTPSNLKVLLNNQRIQVVCWLYVDHSVALGRFQCCVWCSHLWFMSWLNGNLRNTKIYPLNSKLVV